ncbi:MAG TPA: hypothetical protein VG714_00440 [Acidobacteriaceae bacterium]|nr:hypothetical protein [Acidobacteriaceae bacterium]
MIQESTDRNDAKLSRRRLLIGSATLTAATLIGVPEAAAGAPAIDSGSLDANEELANTWTTF